MSHGPATRQELCRACGAALDAAVDGGSLTCDACASETDASERVLERIRLVRPAVDPELDTAAKETARLETLAEQARDYDAESPYAAANAPAGLEHLRDTSAPSPSRMLQAQQSLLTALKRLDRGDGDPKQEHQVFWLARRLADLLDAPDDLRRASAVLQAAEHRLEDPAYKHLLRCRLAEQACGAGDLQGAAAWLTLCDPAPWLLEPDTALRLAQAALAAGRVSWDMVLELVGERTGDLPIEPAFTERMHQLRNEALKHLDRPLEAAAQIDSTSPEKDVDATEDATQRRGFYKKLLGLQPQEDAEAPEPAILPPAGAAENKPPPKSRSKTDKKPGGPNWIVFAFMVLALGLGLMTSLLHGPDFLTASRSEGWKPTPGRVLKASVEAETSGSGDDQSTEFYPKIKYSYEVAGKQYTGTRLTWSQSDSEHSSTEKAKKQLAKYPVGDTVTVYYNPQRPKEAVLKRGWGKGLLDYVLLGVALLLAGFVLLIIFGVGVLRLLAWRARNRA